MPGRLHEGLGLSLYRLTEAAFAKPRGPEVQDPTARLSAFAYGSAGPCRWPANDRPLSLERGPVFSLGFRV